MEHLLEDDDTTAAEIEESDEEARQEKCQYQQEVRTTWNIIRQWSIRAELGS
jgi:hypothetical protein